jgi:hypothetical protein
MVSSFAPHFPVIVEFWPAALFSVEIQVLQTSAA